MADAAAVGGDADGGAGGAGAAAVDQTAAVTTVAPDTTNDDAAPSGDGESPATENGLEDDEEEDGASCAEDWDDECDFCHADNDDVRHVDWCGCLECLKVILEWDEERQMKWLVPGAFYDHRESSYETNDNLSEAQEQTRRLYDQMTATELRRCVRDRGLLDPYPEGLTVKYFYIRALQAADRSPSFDRFLDLPTELRLEVCRYMLILQEELRLYEAPKRYCEPTILQTCKQVYQEAKDILYSENVIHCEFSVWAEDDAEQTTNMRVHNAEVWDNDKFYAFPNGIDAWPEFFRRIRHLEVEVSYIIEGTEHVLGDGFLPLNKMMYTLASFLMEGNQLKTIDLKLDMDEDMETWGFTDVLYPFLRLRGIRTVKITGEVPDHCRKKLLLELRSESPSFNTLRQAKLLLDEAASQIALAWSCFREVDCYCEECDQWPRGVLGLEKCVRDVKDAVLEHTMSSTLERNMQARLAKLQKQLDKFERSGVQEKASKAMLAARARKSYATQSMQEILVAAEEEWKNDLLNKTAMYRGDDDWDIREDQQSGQF